MNEATAASTSTSESDASFVYDAWHSAAITADVQSLIDLYCDDAVMETYMAVILLKRESGLLQGKSEVAHFLEVNFAERRSLGLDGVARYHRSAYQFDGKTLTWEYLRETPDGDSHEVSEVLELSGRQIKRHRIYFGWHLLASMRRAGA